MAWAKIDDGWWCHPKVMNLSLVASGLWARALSWSCHQRRDTVPPRFLAMVGADVDAADELVAAGLWLETEDGYRIHDWAKYQERSTSEKRAEAGRIGGKRSGESRRSKADTETTPDLQKHEATGKQTKQTGEANDEAGALPGPSLPNPTQDQTHPLDEEASTFEEHFWPAYPPTNGRKPEKGKALAQWRKLTVEQRRRALVGARNLAKADTIPKHAHRFLRKDTGGEFPFDDWQQPPTPATGGREPPSGALPVRGYDPDDAAARFEALTGGEQ